MAYKRKTRDIWVIEQDFGGGWEEVNTETSRKEGLRSLREYEENQPSGHTYYPVRMKMKRERIEDDNPNAEGAGHADV